MKKFLCMLLAVVAVSAFAGCGIPFDKKCDECGKNGNFKVKEGEGMANIDKIDDVVLKYDTFDELCMECASKKYMKDAPELDAGKEAWEKYEKKMEKVNNNAKKSLEKRYPGFAGLANMID